MIPRKFAWRSQPMIVYIRRNAGGHTPNGGIKIVMQNDGARAEHFINNHCKTVSRTGGLGTVSPPCFRNCVVEEAH